MSDTLEIFGNEYENVAGFKVKDENGNELTYIKGGGGSNDFVVSLSKNNQTGYWEPDKTWSEVSAAIADNKTFVFYIAGMTGNSELAADGIVYNDGLAVYLTYIVYETLQDQSNNYYTNEYFYEFKSTGVTQDGSYVYYDTSNADATAVDILSGKTAFNSSGSVSGSIQSKTSADLAANNLTVTAPSGYYASAASKTLTDANLTAGNIKKDVTIFGTTGTYEGGGGLTKVTGSFTVASNSLTMYVTGLGGTPKFVKFYIHENAFDGVSKFLGGIYVDGACATTQTNNAGTAGGTTYQHIGDSMGDPVILADNTDPGTDRFAATTTGFAVHCHASSWQFKAGYTYDYVVFY